MAPGLICYKFAIIFFKLNDGEKIKKTLAKLP